MARTFKIHINKITLIFHRKRKVRILSKKGLNPFNRLDLQWVEEKSTRIKKRKKIRYDYPSKRKLYNKLVDYYTFIRAGGGVVQNELGEFLLIYRKGYWDLPKGKIEKGETRKAGAKREVEEECGVSELKVKSFFLCTLHTYKIKKKKVLKKSYWYHMICPKQDLVPQAEEGIEAAIWVSKSDLPKYFSKSYPNIKEILKILAD
ncbi:MAG: 8-oxo-dGTP pyrophosphatase MutT (NUDIX family) [Sphingobacteriales bacterium]|jgi:8-oxo-dGTP pyrophosphatase MutT (NUDIX family)